MQCRHHPDREAKHICATCNTPICNECAEEVKPGTFMCFQCAMLQSVSEVGTALEDKQERATKQHLEKKKKKWGPFQYFMIISGVLIAVMWGVILFGGQKAPTGTANILEQGKAGRVFLFLVDGALKRYAHYEGNKYPDQLMDLIPDYLKIQEDQVRYLNSLKYELDDDPNIGYKLSFAFKKPGEMNIILTSQGLKYTQPVESGS